MGKIIKNKIYGIIWNDNSPHTSVVSVLNVFIIILWSMATSYLAIKYADNPLIMVKKIDKGLIVQR
jgi:hypothetical protein